jgi:hypothetical protein
MVSKRSLPERRNPLIEPDNSPSHEILVERRRLGQTNLAVKPGVVGVANSSKPEHLGTFDYAHLRVPLPKDLSGSGIFSLTKSTSYPESYFLMRRSSDGYISATGMFKAAFPWASLAEEEAERRYQKTFPSAGPDEVAGSVWIAPEEALQLSEEYGMRLWIVALLDPEPIEKANKDRHNNAIQMPPKFDVSKVATPVLLPPSSALRSTRSRASRSASPSKIATPSRKIASPRKSRATRHSAKAEAVAKAEEAKTENATAATSALQHVMENGTTASESVATESVAPESVNGDSVRIEVQETVEQDGEVETTTTNVKVEVPASHPDLPVPENPEEMIATAKKMVEEAHKLEGKASVNGIKSSKRKVEEMKDGDEEEEEADKTEDQPAKRARTEVTEQALRKERMAKKALAAVTLIGAFGAAFGYIAQL